MATDLYIHRCHRLESELARCDELEQRRARDLCTLKDINQHEIVGEQRGEALSSALHGVVRFWFGAALGTDSANHAPITRSTRRNPCGQYRFWGRYSQFSLQRPAARSAQCPRPSRRPRSVARRRRRHQALPRLWVSRPVICRHRDSVASGCRGPHRVIRPVRAVAPISRARHLQAAGYCIARARTGKWCRSGSWMGGAQESWCTGESTVFNAGR